MNDYDKLTCVMRFVPITNGTVKPRLPIKGKEQHGTVALVGEDVNDGMNHTTENERLPSMSACIGLPTTFSSKKLSHGKTLDETSSLLYYRFACIQCAGDYQNDNHSKIPPYIGKSCII